MTLMLFNCISLGCGFEIINIFLSARCTRSAQLYTESKKSVLVSVLEAGEIIKATLSQTISDSEGAAACNLQDLKDVLLSCQCQIPESMCWRAETVL